MGRPRTRPMDMKVMSDLWRNDDFTAMTATAQALCLQSIGEMGARAKISGYHFTAADARLDPIAFQAVARELVNLGVWCWIDDDTVEVSEFRPHIFLMEHNRPRTPLWLRTLILDRDGNACLFCGSTEKLELDHIIPWSKGGASDVSNLQTLCKACNFKKGATV